jgi:flagellar basal body-associated protein FliL
LSDFGVNQWTEHLMIVMMMMMVVMMLMVVVVMVMVMVMMVLITCVWRRAVVFTPVFVCTLEETGPEFESGQQPNAHM